ncbi:hypothetical protein [Pedococcus sp. P5_B7]
MSCTGPNTLNPLCVVSNAVADQANAAATSTFTHIAGYFGTAAEHATVWLWKEIDHATTLDLRSPDLLRELAITGAIAGVICMGLFVIQVIRGMLRREAGALGRALSGLVVATIGTTFALAATQALLTAVDALSAGVVQATMGTNISGLGAKLTAVRLSSTGNPATVLLLSLVILAAVVIVWAAMLARKLMLLVAAVLAPIAFAGAVADFSRAWVRRWIEFVVAMVACKLLLVIILSIGVAVLDGAGQASGGATQATTQMVGGALVLLLGGLAPWIAIKTCTFAGEALHAAHVSAIHSSSGARAVISAPRKVVALTSTARALVPGVGAAGGVALGMAAGGGGGRAPAKRGHASGALDNSPRPVEAHGDGSAQSRPVGAGEQPGRVAASATPPASTGPAAARHSTTPPASSPPTGPNPHAGPSPQPPHQPPPPRQ